jgi:hypothetical protein
MTVAETVIAAVAAGGGLGGLAALISAVRPPGPSPVQPHRPGSHVPASWRRRQYAGPARKPVSRAASWPLALAASSCLLAGAQVAVVGTTAMSLSQAPIVLLTIAAAASAGLSLWVSGHLLWRGVSQGQPDVALYAGAGLVIAFAALTAVLIAGSG